MAPHNIRPISTIRTTVRIICLGHYVLSARGKGHLNDNVKMLLGQKEKLEKQISNSPSVLQENPVYSISHSMSKNIYHYHKIITGTCIIIDLYLLLLCVHAFI